MRIFKHYMLASLLILGAVETSILFLSMYAGVGIRFWRQLRGMYYVGPVLPIYPKAIVFASMMLGIMIAMGLYQREHQPQSWHYGRLSVSFIAGLAAMTVVFYAVPELFLGRGAFSIAYAIAFAAIAVARFSYFKLTGYNANKRRILVLGTGTRAAKVDALEKSGNGQHGFRIVGYLALQGAHHFVAKDKILSDDASLCEIARKYEVDEIVVGVRDRRDGGLPINDVLLCKLNGIDIIDLPSFFERETGYVQLQAMNPSWLIFSDGFDRGPFRDASKRMFDVIASTLLLGISLPVMLVTAILIKLDSSGPVLYRQSRVGRGNVPFDVLKFRSMRTDAEKDGKPRWASRNDDRTTRVGRVIRKLRIDELPQIFNVFRGEMSFVGPRPERPYFVEQLSKQIPFFMCRHNVKPGITGWAQIRCSYGASVEDAIEKLQYDLYYVKNHSLFLDMVVLFQTVQVILFGKGSR
ncbi:MAG: TIGR03013 family XrtA/PEP-CTERM system glycosyltransferase [Acidiferrobacterales bacterium]